MTVTAASSAGVNNAGRFSQCRLVPWPLVVDDANAFATSSDGKPDIVPAIVARVKQALLDDLRKLILQGVEARPDGLECSPTEESLAVAERLISSLPNDVAMPSVSVPDDGEITFSWQTVEDAGEHWRAVLAIAPDCEVECFVRRRSHHRPKAHFRTKDEAGPFGLPDDIVSALRTHWRAA